MEMGKPKTKPIAAQEGGVCDPGYYNQSYLWLTMARGSSNTTVFLQNEPNGVGAKLRIDLVAPMRLRGTRLLKRCWVRLGSFGIMAVGQPLGLAAQGA
jgi:hypothetical protein